MSIVWLVERADGTRAALKLLSRRRPAFAQRSQARFLREIRRVSRAARTRASCACSDAGEHEGRPVVRDGVRPGA
jgi:hypothetical protein